MRTVQQIVRETKYVADMETTDSPILSWTSTSTSTNNSSSGILFNKATSQQDVFPITW
jgi:hypothetical protein